MGTINTAVAINPAVAINTAVATGSRPTPFPKVAADPRGIIRRSAPATRTDRRMHFFTNWIRACGTFRERTMAERLRERLAIRSELRCEQALIRLHFPQGASEI